VNTRRWFWPLLLLWLLPWQAAWAKGGGEKAFLIGVVVVGGTAIFAFLVGLAFHALVLGYAPRRGRALVLAASGKHRWKTLLLGLVNTFALAVIFGWAEHRAPALAVLALVTWFVSVLMGSHGIARGLGRKVLGLDPEDVSAAPNDLRALAVGWFVFAFVAAIPMLGYALLFYWSLRSTGVVVYTLLAPDAGPQLDPPIVSVSPREPAP
jgi:hypothetical protein